MRRQQIVEESNAIGTAYLRLDLLPAEAQPPLRDLFRRYVDVRLETFRKLPDLHAAEAELAKGTAMQQAIWSRAVAACKSQNAVRTTMLLLPALNQMIDISATRTMTARLHPPTIVFDMLVGLALVGALLAGYGLGAGRSRSWIHVLALSAIVAMTVYVILDVEYPRIGFIRVDAFDRALIDLRRSMK